MDSMSNILNCPGCIESLLHYKRILLETHIQQGGTDDKLLKECLRCVTTLERIDPFRALRYKEIGKCFFHIAVYP